MVTITAIALILYYHVDSRDFNSRKRLSARPLSFRNGPTYQPIKQSPSTASAKYISSIYASDQDDPLCEL